MDCAFLLQVTKQDQTRALYIYLLLDTKLIIRMPFVPCLLKLMALFSVLLNQNYYNIPFLLPNFTSSELSSQLSKSNFPCQLSLSSLPTASHQTLVLHLIQFKTRFGAISKQRVIFRPSYGLVGREDIHWRRSYVIDACPTAIPAIQNLR